MDGPGIVIIVDDLLSTVDDELERMGDEVRFLCMQCELILHAGL